MSMSPLSGHVSGRLSLAASSCSRAFCLRTVSEGKTTSASLIADPDSDPLLLCVLEVSELVPLRRPAAADVDVEVEPPRKDDVMMMLLLKLGLACSRFFSAAEAPIEIILCFEWTNDLSMLTAPIDHSVS